MCLLETKKKNEKEKRKRKKKKIENALVRGVDKMRFMRQRLNFMIYYTIFPQHNW